MKKDDSQEINGANDDGNEQRVSALEHQRNMKIIQQYQRFPLSDIYKEKRGFIKEMKKKYGERKMEKVIAEQIQEYKVNNQIQMANELTNIYYAQDNQ